MRKTLAFIAVLVGLFASTYLTWAYTSSSHRMVCLGGGCDTVRASQYAHLFGLPMPVYGLAFYGFLAVMMLAESWRPQCSARIWRLIMILTAVGLLFSGWLTYLEGFVIHAWCEWCVTQASAVTVAFLLALTIVVRPPKETVLSTETTGEIASAGASQLRVRLAVLLMALVIGIPALFLVIRHEKKQTEQTGPAPQDIVDSPILIRPDSHQAGPANAPLTIVEFGDFECPSCGAAEKTNRVIRGQYGTSVRFVFRQFPLEKLHPFAFQAAKASECAARQDKFWPMVEVLYSGQADLTAPALKKYAAEQGLDAAKFDACLEDPAVAARIRQDIADGEALGVKAMPTFFLNGKKIVGGLTLPQDLVNLPTLIHPDSHQTGPANAPLTIVEFGDFQCPSCGAAEKTNRTIRQQYGDKVRFVFRQFPLEKMHQFAFAAAKASECAAQQGNFWPMAEELYTNQADLTAPALKKYAAEQGLDQAKFDACMEGPAVTARIRQDIADGTALGVRATPTFFLNGKKIEGGLTFMDVEAALSAATVEATRSAVTKDQSAAQTQPPPDKPVAPQTKPAPAVKPATQATQPVPDAGAKRTPAPHGNEGVSPKSNNPPGFNPGSKGFSALAQQTQSSPFVPCGIEETPAQDPPMIHVADMKKLFNDKSAVFVDVRGSGAFKEAHIPTAVNATVDQLQKQIPPELPKSKLIVFYEAGGADDSCTTSKTAGRILMQNGFKEVKVFKEGLEGWKKEGLPVAQ